MPRSDTSLGGRGGDFPTTIWSRILDGGGQDEESRRESVSTLAHTYWKPIYRYIRCRWAKTNDEAKDLTQEFFLWILERDFLSRADPRRGRFRAFVKASLANFMHNDERAKRRQKRGGDRHVFALEGLDEEASRDLADPAGTKPEDVLDQAWKAELLGRAARRLKDAYEAEGHGHHYELFRDYYLTDGSKMDYKEGAARFGLTTSDVARILAQARGRFRETVAGLVAETVTNARELRDELKALFGEAML